MILSELKTQALSARASCQLESSELSFLVLGYECNSLRNPNEQKSFFRTRPYFFSTRPVMEINFVLFFGPHCAACEVLVLQPGIEPGSTAVKVQVLTTGPPGNSLNFVLYDHDLEGIGINPNGIK